MTAGGSESADLDRQTTRLANERAALFEKAGASFGLSASDQQRLQMIERELDECFLTRRRRQAERDASRFERDGLRVRRTIPRPPAR